MLGYPEREVWRMTPYKIMRLFEIHKSFYPDRFGGSGDLPEGLDAIDIALGGL